MNVIEINPISGYFLLYSETRYIGLHESDWVAAGTPVKAEDCIYEGRIILVVSEAETKALLHEWFQNGPLIVNNPEDRDRVPESLMVRIDNWAQKLAA